MFESLKGKKALITGSSSGIGAKSAILLSEYGVELGIHYFSNKSGALNVAKEIEKRGKKCELFQGDLLDNNFTDGLVDQFVNAFGKIDILVNNAGAPESTKPFLELTWPDWENTLKLNVLAPFFLAQNAFKSMQKSGGGKIINISSISAKYGGGFTSLHYGASKASLESVTKGFAKFGAKYNILVNAIRPGFIDTPAHKKMKRDENDIRKRIELIPLKRAGIPEDVARMAVFLASEAGDYITGEIFTVSGGD